MANYGGFNFTSFRGVNLKNTAIIRVEADGVAGTVAIKELDSAREWFFPNKSGTLAIGGTFIVQLPAITAGNWAETSVTVTGVRTEDALVVTLQDTFNTVTSDRPMAFLAGARPANGGVHLTFMNPVGTATIYNEMICAYSAAR